MDLLTWIVVGLVAGALAAALLSESSLGLLGDLALGVVGAFVGGWGFRALGWSPPFAGVSGVIVVALTGAIAVLVAVRLVRSMLVPGVAR